MQKIKIQDFKIGENEPLTIISGPCVIENEHLMLKQALALKEIFSKYRVNFIFKASYDKANRSSIDSFRGPGLEKGLEILQKVKEELSLPITTDIHSPYEAKASAEVCDIVQIPAFLCRQTDLLVAAGETKKVVNIKKGQFMAPWDMENVVKKVQSTGNQNIILTERGVSFGYNYLIADMCSIPIMKKLGFPVCFDASHSVQLPGGLKTSSGGKREFIPTLARASIASGANIIFIETHSDPKNAKSDSATVFPFEKLPKLIEDLLALYELMQQINK